MLGAAALYLTQLLASLPKGLVRAAVGDFLDGFRAARSANRLTTAQKNIEALRKWAKESGYERVSKLSEKSIERWNDPSTGKYRLKIKTKSAEYGESKKPRFEAKTGDGQWINPLDGKRGEKS